jgi:hypothetical protein
MAIPNSEFNRPEFGISKSENFDGRTFGPIGCGVVGVEFGGTGVGFRNLRTRKAFFEGMME